jgi:hypothetical protein
MPQGLRVFSVFRVLVTVFPIQLDAVIIYYSVRHFEAAEVYSFVILFACQHPEI